MDKVAIYCRLSKEDEDKMQRGDDSESIKNQKLMLIDYATDHDMQIYKIYVDDDFSGADQERPSWNQMLKDAESGEFDTVLCKSQSRFARSLEVVEKYINGLFLDWGIRFISIVDGIDNNVKSSRKTSQINGLMDQWYLEDMSENIKRVYRNKMKAGEYLGAFACYGYKRSTEDKYKIEIDREAADVVQKIFDLYIKGYGVKQICNILTEEKVKTPTQYKQSLGLTYKNPKSSFSVNYGAWGTTTVRRILTNKTYIGYLIQGRERTVSYKSKKVVIAPEDEWVVIKNNHEPIIEHDIFYKVQNLLKSKRTVSTNQSGKKKAHCLAGKVKCKDCNSTMVKANGNEISKSYLRCQLASKTNNTKCTPHSIRFSELIDEVSKKLHEDMNIILNNEKNMEQIAERASKKIDLEKKIINLTHEKKKIESKLSDISDAIKSLYVDKTKGIIDNSMFLELQQGFQNDKTILQDNMNEIDKEINVLNEMKSIKVDSLELAKKHYNFTELTNEIVCDLVEYIEIGEKDVYGDREIIVHTVI